MTPEQMDRLAHDSLSEDGHDLKLFAADHVQNKAHVWALSFAKKDGAFINVEVDLWDHKTPEAIKAEIVRQIGVQL